MYGRMSQNVRPMVKWSCDFLRPTRVMLIGEYLRLLREHKNLSQGEIEARTGLLRCYISRVENGHTVPAIETLEKFARALEVPLYAIFYGASQKEGDESAEPRGRGRRQTRRILEALGRVSDRDRKLILLLALALTNKKRGK